MGPKYSGPDLLNTPFLSVRSRLVKPERAPDRSLSLQFPRVARRRRAFDELEVWRPQTVDATAVVHQLAVDRQREIVHGDDLVVIADVRHGDEVVGRHFPACLHTSTIIIDLYSGVTRVGVTVTPLFFS